MSDWEMAQLYEPVIGFRAWTLHPDGRLGAAIRKRGFTWPEGSFQAGCLRPGELACETPPGADCACGIYAWHSSRRRSRFGADDNSIAGAVLAWGEIEVTPTGFRAEWARPVVLCIDPAWPTQRLRAADLAARRYGAVMTVAEHLETLASDYGSSVPRNERPVAPLDEAIFQIASGRPTSFTFDSAINLQRLLGRDRPAETALFADSIDLLLREARARWHLGSSLASLLQAGAAGLLHACRFHGRDPWLFRPVALWWIERGMHLLAADPAEPFEHRVFLWSELHAEMRPIGPTDAQVRALREKAAVIGEPEELRLTPSEHRALLEELLQGTGDRHRGTLAGHLYVWARRSGLIEET